jgi:hypothetical protein
MDGFRAFLKETGCHPVSSRPTASTGYILIQFGYHQIQRMDRNTIVMYINIKVYVVCKI